MENQQQLPANALLVDGIPVLLDGLPVVVVLNEGTIMAVTIGDNPISPTQAAELRAAFGVLEPTPLTETKNILADADQAVIFDSEDSGRPKLTPLAALSLYVGSAPAATAPAAFTSGQWTATAGNAQVVINITELPSNGGSAITELQYRIDGGDPVALTGTGTGERTISGLVNGEAVDVQLRAVNAIGAADWSDIKTRTPSAGSGGDLNVVQMATPRADFGSDLSLTFGANVAAGNHVLAALNTDDSARTFSSTLGTQDATGTPSGARVSGFRTNNVATPATVFAYSLSSGWSFGAVGIEVSGNAPVFDTAVYVVREDSSSGAARTINVDVAVNNSIVLVIFGGDNERSFTIGGGLTGGSHGTPRYVHAAYGKFAAGSHTLSLTPGDSLTMGPIGVFVWSPGS